MQIGLKTTLQFLVITTFLLLSLLTSSSNASPLKVGTYPCPPFVIGSVDSDLNGLSIELWEQIAKEMSIEFRFENQPLDDLLNAIETEQIDIGVSCISITPERELFADFSHSFYETHLAIAVKTKAICIPCNLSFEPSFVAHRWCHHIGSWLSRSIFLCVRRREKRKAIFNEKQKRSLG